MSRELTIEKLDKNKHNRIEFDCGIVELNDFIKMNANQNQRNDISNTFIGIDKSADIGSILGYYTLSGGQLNCDEFPGCLKLPRFPIPMVRLARLAVDKKYHNQGIGAFLLYDAFTKAMESGKLVAAYAFVVDAKPHAVSFYTRYGFQCLQDNTSTLFLRMKEIRKLFEES